MKDSRLRRQLKLSNEAARLALPRAGHPSRYPAATFDGATLTASLP